MNNDMKRRTFIGLTVGALIAAPLTVRYFAGNRKGLPRRNFVKELKAYENMIDVTINPADGPATFTLPLRPQPGQEWTYLLFSPSFLPNELSQAAPGEPDAFIVRKGSIEVAETQSSQIVIVGGDDVFKICSPRHTDERKPAEIALMFKDGKLFPAKEKGTKANPDRDTQFEHLLALQGIPAGELTVGKRWKGNTGRLRPFNYATNYEVAGFAEVAGRKTAEIRFDATISNFVVTPGKQADTGTNTHRGKAYFDLETGMLVRQEIEMTALCPDVKGTKKSVAVETKLFVQLFTA